MKNISLIYFNLKYQPTYWYEWYIFNIYIYLSGAHSNKS